MTALENASKGADKFSINVQMVHLYISYACQLVHFGLPLWTPVLCDLLLRLLLFQGSLLLKNRLKALHNLSSGNVNHFPLNSPCLFD
jgi:hypothetical protein